MHTSADSSVQSITALIDEYDDFAMWTSERRFRAVAVILARGLQRALDLQSSFTTFSAGRSSENPANSSASELASEPAKSVTVPTG
jgi:hypothetical protein